MVHTTADAPNCSYINNLFIPSSTFSGSVVNFYLTAGDSNYFYNNIFDMSSSVRPFGGSGFDPSKAFFDYNCYYTQSPTQGLFNGNDFSQLPTAYGYESNGFNVNPDFYMQ